MRFNNPFLSARFLSLLLGIQLINDRLLTISVRFPIEPVINGCQQDMGFNIIRVFFDYGLKERLGFPMFPSHVIEPGQVIARIRITRTQARSA